MQSCCIIEPLNADLAFWVPRNSRSARCGTLELRIRNRWIAAKTSGKWPELSAPHDSTCAPPCVTEHVRAAVIVRRRNAVEPVLLARVELGRDIPPAR
jgi:hypothetical protein